MKPPAGPGNAMPIIRIERLNKWFGDFHVLKEIDLDVAKSERIVICGPSGSGKSTLMRCINRLGAFQRGRSSSTASSSPMTSNGSTGSAAKPACFSRASTFSASDRPGQPHPVAALDPQDAAEGSAGVGLPLP